MTSNVFIPAMDASYQLLASFYININVSDEDCADPAVWCAPLGWSSEDKPALFCGFENYETTIQGKVNTENLYKKIHLILISSYHLSL